MAFIPEFTYADDWSSKEKQELFDMKDNAQGGFLTNNGFWSHIIIRTDMCSWIPKGIAKKFSVCVNPSPRQDTIAPRLQSVSVTHRTESSAIIEIKTNEDSSARVYFDNRSDFEIGDDRVSVATSTNTSAMLHVITLSELAPSTRYYFIIELKDASDNKRVSREYSFTTRIENNDENNPEILTLDVSKTLATSATLKVVASEPVTVVVNYSVKGSSVVNTKESIYFAREHTILLSSLSANTEYEARVTVRDRDGNTEISRLMSLKTLLLDDITKPVISDIEVALNLTAKTAMVTWETDEASDSRIRYSSKIPFNSATAVQVYNKDMVKNHGLKLENLAAAVTYSFQIESTDATGNTAVSGVGMFNISSI